MKGWHHHSYEHSLAARGIRSKKYFYHGTSKNKLKEIRERGLISEQPRTHVAPMDQYIYLTNDREVAVSYAYNAAGAAGWISGDWDDDDDHRPVILRIKRDELKKIGKVIPDPVNRRIIPECRDFEFIFNKNIPPELIEVFTPNGWKRIMDIRRI